MPRKKTVRETKKKGSGKIENALDCTSIRKEVDLHIEGVTHLMEAAYNLDVDLVKLCLEEGEDLHAKDKKGNDVRKYLFAGYNEKMVHFAKMHPKSEHVLTDKMTKREREEYESLSNRLEEILTLFHDHNSAT